MSGGPPAVVLDVAGIRWRVDLAAYAVETASRLADDLHRLWSRSCVTSRGDEPVVDVVPPGSALRPAADEHIVAGEDRSSFPYAFSRALTLLTIERRAGSALLLHAAAVASGNGRRAVVLVAPSGTGKSTAAQALGRDLGYITDELVVIEQDLSLSPYPKPISLVAADRPGDKDEWSADELALGPTPSGRTEVVAMVLLHRDPNTGAPVLTRPSLADAMLELIAQSSSIWLLDRPLELLATAATRAGGPFELCYAEISTCVEAVAQLLAEASTGPASPGERSDWRAHSPTTDQRWRATKDVASSQARLRPDLRSARVIRAPWTDAVETAGEVVLLLGPQPVRLSGVGARIWLATGQPMTIDALVDAAVEAHGAHPDAVAIVTDVVRQYLGAGVLTLAEQAT